jgi:hypothetical protein
MLALRRYGCLQCMLGVLLFHALAISAAAEEVKRSSAQTEILPSQSSPLSTQNDAASVAPIETVDFPPVQDDWLPRYSLGTRTWISWGNSERTHTGPGPVGFANPLSDLRWQNLTSQALEINGSAIFFNRLIISGDFGAGVINGGHFRDQDFAFSGHQGVFSDTLSPALDDNLRYFNADVGWRFHEGPYFSFDGLVGYQYWRERYVAEGGAFIVPSGLIPLPPGPVITEEFTWQGFRIGVQGVVQFSPRWSFKSRVMCMPGMQFKNEDIHHLRVDLRQDPSIIDRAGGGIGILGDFRFSYWMVRGLFLEVGYRVFAAQSGIGETTVRLANGPDGNLPFNVGQTVRQGMTFGLTYQF